MLPSSMASASNLVFIVCKKLESIYKYTLFCRFAKIRSSETHRRGLTQEPLRNPPPSKQPPGMRRSRMLPENPPSKPPPEMRGGNAGAGARGRERGTKCGRGPGGRSRRQNPPPKAWGRMWGAGLGRSTGPGYAARNTGPERETGAHRPEHGTGVRAGVRGSKCEADAGRNARSRGARTGL